ncbi:MAG: hypothetical protein F4Z04_00360 [Acidobacteria bacterium]|nr:hypothetical protein [Acidobacteriota bacterium]
MLDLWRSPEDAGDPVGCLATTYTFHPGLFDEQCLARFLEIESEPNREDLAFLLERETRLGSVYAGVLVDHTQAGVEHSLRWDVLPVRVRAGKQHAKITLLSWTRRLRIIVASANLTEAGYRSNFEVAAAVDMSPDDADFSMLGDAVTFLRRLVSFVPGAADDPPEVQRLRAFLDQVERQTGGWRRPRRGGKVRQQLVFTLPTPRDAAERAPCSLEDAMAACRKRGWSPTEARVASPFFDHDDGDADHSQVTGALCKRLGRRMTRRVTFCVPAQPDGGPSAVPRLMAPRSLVRTAEKYQARVVVEMLPHEDHEKNSRPWHAKMLTLRAEDYSALMIGSSNFTCAGMGVTPHRHAEANLLTLVDRREAYGREAGRLEAIWPEMEVVMDPDAAEWLGAKLEEEDEQATTALLPLGFLSATYRAGEVRQIILRLDPAHLPADWRVHACGRDERELMTDAMWREAGQPNELVADWDAAQPPDRLLVRWAQEEAFVPLNVEDSRSLPPPPKLEEMTADEMLSILATGDPSAAFRVWARRQQSSELFDENVDAAMPPDLDPLRRYGLEATFLHRIRLRARVLGQVRANLEQPVWSRQALEWRLRGLIGVEQLGVRLARELAEAGSAADEALLTLADFLIVLGEVNYRPTDGALSKDQFDELFRPFLLQIADRLNRQVNAQRDSLSVDVIGFWERVVGRCRS